MKTQHCARCYGEVIWAEGEDSIEVAFDVQPIQIPLLVLLPNSKSVYEMIPTHALHKTTCPYKKEAIDE